LYTHASGFEVFSEWQPYAMQEDVFNSLPDFLDGKIYGRAHDRQEQLRSYGKIAANYDGTCGEKVHRFLCDHCGAMEEAE
jgi:hypothetical protein